MSFLIAAAAAFACASPTFHDGDNIRCAGGPSMRLAGIDAPEWKSSPKCRRQNRGRAICDDRLAAASRDHLKAMAANGTVKCRVVDANAKKAGFQATDMYGRLIVRCDRAGLGDLSEAQVRAGKARRWE